MKLTKRQYEACLQAAQDIEEERQWWCCISLRDRAGKRLSRSFSNFFGQGPGSWWSMAEVPYAQYESFEAVARREKVLAILLFAEAHNQ